MATRFAAITRAERIPEPCDLVRARYLPAVAEVSSLSESCVLEVQVRPLLRASQPSGAVHRRGPQRGGVNLVDHLLPQHLIFVDLKWPMLAIRLTSIFSSTPVNRRSDWSMLTTPIARKGALTPS